MTFVVIAALVGAVAAIVWVPIMAVRQRQREYKHKESDGKNEDDAQYRARIRNVHRDSQYPN